MPVIHKNKICYADLPKHLCSTKVTQAKADIGLNIVVPKGLEAKTEKFINKMQKQFSRAFDDFIEDQGEF